MPKGELRLLGGGVTRQAAAGPRSSEAEVELRVADVNGRLQWKRVIVGKSNGKDETVAFGGVIAPTWRVNFLLCEVGGHFIREKSRDP